VAIYHLSVKPVSRGAGRSATAAAAYRAAERILDHSTGQVFDYTRKLGIEHAEIVLPLDAAKRDINWARDRQQLWNAAEFAEKRQDARVAREYEIALPQELTKSQRLELTRTFSQELANRYGCAVDFALHEPHRQGDVRNFHAHILTTTRQIEATGLGAKTSIEWSDTDRAKRGFCSGKEEIAEIRERWAVLTNEKLQTLGHEARIDHRSLEAQGIELEPTVHLGPAVSGMERRGIATEVGERIRAEVQARLELAAEIGRLQREIEQVNRSIIELSTDIRAALTARNTGQSQGAAMRWDGEPRQTNEQMREAAREQWLEYRAQQVAKGMDMGMGQGMDTEFVPGRRKGHEMPDDDFSL